MATTLLREREHEPARIPLPGVYRLDPGRCVVDATARQPWLTSVHARMTAESGQLVIDHDPLASWVRVDLRAGSLTTGLTQRDDALRGPSVLDAAAFPLVRFESALVSPRNPGRFSVEGDLYVRDRVVSVTVQARLAEVSPSRVLVAATGRISWRALGLGWGSTLERAGMVGDRIVVTVAAEFAA